MILNDGGAVNGNGSNQDDGEARGGAGDTGLLMIRRSLWPAFMCLSVGLFAVGFACSLLLEIRGREITSWLELGARMLMMCAIQGTGAIMASWITIIALEVLKMGSMIASEEIIKFFRLDRIRAWQIRRAREEGIAIGEARGYERGLRDAASGSVSNGGSGAD